METATTFSSLLALLANAGVATWGVVALGGRRTASLRSAIVAAVGPAALALGFVIAAASLVGSLYYSEVLGLEPCELCWYQRIAMYPLVAILGVGLWKRHDQAWTYAFPLVAIGTLIAGYHYLIQRVPSLDAGTCSSLIPCSTPYFMRFGFISFPYMSLSAFVAIAVLYRISRAWTRAQRP